MKAGDIFKSHQDGKGHDVITHVEHARAGGGSDTAERKGANNSGYQVRTVNSQNGHQKTHKVGTVLRLDPSRSGGAPAQAHPTEKPVPHVAVKDSPQAGIHAKPGKHGEDLGSSQKKSNASQSEYHRPHGVPQKTAGQLNKAHARAGADFKATGRVNNNAGVPAHNKTTNEAKGRASAHMAARLQARQATNRPNGGVASHAPVHTPAAKNSGTPKSLDDLANRIQGERQDHIRGMSDARLQQAHDANEGQRALLAGKTNLNPAQKKALDKRTALAEDLKNEMRGRKFHMGAK